MHVILRPGVVLLAAFALVLVGAFTARLDGASAVSGGPEMRLTANGCTVDCSFATSESFTLAVDIVTAPATGYVLAQSFIDYGDDLIYDIDGQTVEDEIVWTDLDTRVAFRVSFGAGLIYHGGLSGLGRLAVSTYIGNFVEIKMTCTADDTSTQVDLLPLGDQQTVTSGTAFAEGDLHTLVRPKVSGLVIHCGVGGPLDTPTRTPPQTSTPAPPPTPPPTLTPLPGLTQIPPPTVDGKFHDATIGGPLGPSAVPRGTGDVSCDTDVNSIDATLILQLHARLIAALPCPEDSDVNGDGRTDSVDAALILQFSAGLISSLPP